MLSTSFLINCIITNENRAANESDPANK